MSLVNQVLVSFPLHHFAKSCLFYQFSYSEGSRGPVSDDDRTCPDSLRVLGGGKTDNRCRPSNRCRRAFAFGWFRMVILGFCLGSGEKQSS